MTPDEQLQVSRDVFEMIALATANEVDKAADKLTDLGERLDTNGMYAVCCGLAHAGIHSMTKLFGEAPNLARGDMWALEQINPGAAVENPAGAFAARFMVAYGNDDRPGTFALFDAALHAGPEQYVDSLCALLKQTADLCRLALEEQGAGS